MGGIAVRPAERSEFAEIALLHSTVFSEIGETLDSFLSHAESPGVEILIAAMEEVPFKICGYATLSRRSGAVAYFNWFGVVLDQRGKGAGSSLLKAVMERCKVLGVTEAQLDTRNRFKSAIRLNLKFNFEIIGTYLGSDRDLMIKMRGDLGRAP